MCCNAENEILAGELDFPIMFRGDTFQGVKFIPENVSIDNYKSAEFKVKDIRSQLVVKEIPCNITTEAIEVPTFETTDMPVGTLIYELKVTKHDDSSQVLFFGRFTLRGNIQ